ncbi:MAG TPA: hypothetical protein VGH13_19975, partial [Xanthobacteraceae bacterium]
MVGAEIGEDVVDAEIDQTLQEIMRGGMFSHASVPVLTFASCARLSHENVRTKGTLANNKFGSAVLDLT